MSIKEISLTMKKTKSNLRTYCISHKYSKSLDKLKLIKIGSGAYKKNILLIGLMIRWVKIIFLKNSSYGTLTSIYWIWKNEIKKLNKNDYIGICHYRRFWLKYNHDNIINNKNLEKIYLLLFQKNLVNTMLSYVHL